MQHDHAVPGHVVDARFQTAQAKRVAVAAVVGVGGDEEAEAGGETSGLVGEERSDIAV